MTKKQLDEHFIEEIGCYVEVIFPKNTLELVVEWIRDNLKPNDVFDEDVIAKIASENFLPQDIFSKEELTEWAEADGFVKPQN